MVETPISVRLDEETTERIDVRVKSGQDKSRSHTVVKALDVELNFDPDLSKSVDRFCEALGIDVKGVGRRLFYEGVVADFMARITGYEKAWRRRNNEPLWAFVRFNGQLETGKERLERLTEHYCEVETKRRLETLRRIGAQHGPEALNPVDRAFLEEHQQPVYTEPNLPFATFSCAGEEPKTLNELCAE